VGGYVRFWVERVRAGQRCRHPEAPASAPRDYSREADPAGEADRDPLDARHPIGHPGLVVP
jgi:hypothetical protein